MAAARKIHQHAGNSAKVSALSDFEYRVWTQYILSADDFGVMPATAHRLQADNRALRARSTKKVQEAIERMVAIGLVYLFTHQGDRYLWQKDWQDWQEIRWPRRTALPLPPLTGEASEATQRLFREHSKKSPQNFGETSEKLTSCARARNPNPNPNPQSGDLISEEKEIPTEKPAEPSGLVNWRPATRLPALSAASLHNGRDARRHGMHAWCCDRGLCVPWGLHSDFKARLGGEDGDARLRAWYAATLARYNGQPVGDDLFVFWRNEFAAWVGTVTSRPSSSRTGDTMDAGQKSLRARLERLQTEEGGSHVRGEIEG